MDKSLLSRLVNVIFIAGCLSGCSLQVIKLATLYFKYNDNTDVFIEIPQDITPPSTSICYRYVDILLYSELYRDTGIKIVPDDGITTYARLFYAQSVLTISQIFKYTPSADHFIGSCMIRRIEDYNMDAFTGRACHSHFTIDKFYTLEYMCYRVTPVQLQEFPYEVSAYAVTASNNLYRLAPNASAFRYARFILNPIHVQGSHPLSSMSYVGKLIVPRNSFGHATGLRLEVAYMEVRIKRLPPPFKTACIDYGIKEKHNNTVHWCHFYCMQNKTVNRLSRQPFSGIITIPYDMKHITVTDLENRTFNAILRGIVTECSDTCDHLDCSERFTITNFDKNDNPVMLFVINLPREPFLDINYKPAIQTIEFVVYILSSFGTWFGVSVLAVNPVQLWNRLYRSRAVWPNRLLAINLLARRNARKLRVMKEKSRREMHSLHTKLVVQENRNAVLELQMQTLRSKVAFLSQSSDLK